ncbi:hypothetical protein ACTFIV_006934, partial [Dictyostelium citrinum]
GIIGVQSRIMRKI